MQSLGIKEELFIKAYSTEEVRQNEEGASESGDIQKTSESPHAEDICQHATIKHKFLKNCLKAYIKKKLKQVPNRV